jgi:nucleoside-diphosphate-sugar epimerase
MERILITGAAGFVGRALCKELQGAGFSVRGTLRGQNGELPSDIESVRISSVDGTTDWKEALAGVNSIVHLAARVHLLQDDAPDPLGAYREINVEGTRRLAQAAASAGVRRLVFLSSVKAMAEHSGDHPLVEDDPPHPADPYGVSKREAEEALEQIAESSGLEVVILRPPLVYGPGVGGNFLTLLRLCNRGLPLPLGAVRNTRSLIFVGNLTNAIHSALIRPEAAGRTYLVADGEDVSTPGLIDRLTRALGGKARLIAVPPAWLRTGAHLLGRTGEVERVLSSLAVDAARIRRELDWTPPVTLDEGLRRTAEWYLGERP